MSESDLSLLRRKVLEFYDRGEFPTVKKLRSEMNKAIGYKGSQSSMLKIMKSLGFKYRKCNDGTNVLMERSDIATARNNSGRKWLDMEADSGKEGGPLSEDKNETDDFASEDLPPEELPAKETVFLQIKQEPTAFVDVGEPPGDLTTEGLGFLRVKEEPIEAAPVDSALKLKEEQFEFLPVKRELTFEDDEEDTSKIKLENPVVNEGVPFSGNTWSANEVPESSSTVPD